MYPTRESKSDVDALFAAFASSGAYATFIAYLTALYEQEQADLSKAAIAAVAGDKDMMRFAAVRLGRVQFIQELLGFAKKFQK